MNEMYNIEPPTTQWRMMNVPFPTLNSNIPIPMQMMRLQRMMQACIKMNIDTIEMMEMMDNMDNKTSRMMARCLR